MTSWLFCSLQSLRWCCTQFQHHQCVSNRDTAALHLSISSASILEDVSIWKCHPNNTGILIIHTKIRMIVSVIYLCIFNSLRQRLNRRPFADDIFKCIFLNENEWILPWISLKFVQISNIPALVQIIAWCLPGHKPLSEPMMGSLLTHICVTRPQWVNGFPESWSLNRNEPKMKQKALQAYCHSKLIDPL